MISEAIYLVTIRDDVDDADKILEMRVLSVRVLPNRRSNREFA